MLRQAKDGVIDLIVENAIKYKTQVKILVPIENKIKDILQRLGKSVESRYKILNNLCKQELPF